MLSDINPGPCHRRAATDVQQQHFSALFLYPGFCSCWYHDSLDDTDLKPDLLWENRVADTGPYRDMIVLTWCSPMILSLRCVIGAKLTKHPCVPVPSAGMDSGDIHVVWSSGQNSEVFEPGVCLRVKSFFSSFRVESLESACSCSCSAVM